MRNDRLFGVGVALVTPFKEDDTVDYTALDLLIEHIIAGGINYIVVSGTTGEPATMTASEREQLRNYIRKKVDGRATLVLGIGGNNTRAVVDEIKSTDLTGFDSILSIAPYYTKPNQRGIYAHFEQVAKASPLPVILYNVPGRTSRNVEPDTIAALAHDFPNIAAVKEASGSIAQLMKIIEKTPDDFMVISGDDALTVPMMAVGAKGVISVAANVAPAQCVRMVKAASSGDFTTASQIHYKLLDLMDTLFEDGSPAGAKAALKMLGIMEEHLRLPLVEVCDTVRLKIKAALDKALTA